MADLAGVQVHSSLHRHCIGHAYAACVIFTTRDIIYEIINQLSIHSSSISSCVSEHQEVSNRATYHSHLAVYQARNSHHDCVQSSWLCG